MVRRVSGVLSVNQKIPQKWERIVETAIGAHLINSAKTEKYEVFYWRHVNNEVDFVLRYNEQVIAIEVKSGIKAPKKGMDAFSKMFHPNKVLLVGDSGILWRDFLNISPLQLF